MSLERADVGVAPHCFVTAALRDRDGSGFEHIGNSKAHLTASTCQACIRSGQSMLARKGRAISCCRVAATDLGHRYRCRAADFGAFRRYRSPTTPLSGSLCFLRLFST